MGSPDQPPWAAKPTLARWRRPPPCSACQLGRSSWAWSGQAGRAQSLCKGAPCLLPPQGSQPGRPKGGVCVWREKGPSGGRGGLVRVSSVLGKRSAFQQDTFVRFLLRLLMDATASKGGGCGCSSRSKVGGGTGGPCGYLGQCHKPAERHGAPPPFYCPPREQNLNLIFHEISHCNHVGLIEEVKLPFPSADIRAGCIIKVFVRTGAFKYTLSS